MHKKLLSCFTLAAFFSVGYAWAFQAGFLGFVAYISAGGGISAHNAVLSCREYYNKRAETPFETKLNCVGDAVGFMLKGVAAFVAGGYAEESIREGFLGAVANGNQGRAVIDFSRLNNDINNHPHFLNSEHPVRVESVYASNVGIDNAVAYGVSMGNHTDIIEHHTNGTHSMTWLGDKDSSIRKRSYLDTEDTFFGFGGTIQGLKLTTYVANRDSRLDDEKSNLFDIGTNLSLLAHMKPATYGPEQSAKARPASRMGASSLNGKALVTITRMCRQLQAALDGPRSF